MFWGKFSAFKIRLPQPLPLKKLSHRICTIHMTPFGLKLGGGEGQLSHSPLWLRDCVHSEVYTISVQWKLQYATFNNWKSSNFPDRHCYLFFSIKNPRHQSSQIGPCSANGRLHRFTFKRGWNNWTHLSDVIRTFVGTFIHFECTISRIWMLQQEIQWLIYTCTLQIVKTSTDTMFCWRQICWVVVESNGLQKAQLSSRWQVRRCTSKFRSYRRQCCDLYLIHKLNFEINICNNVLLPG